MAIVPQLVPLHALTDETRVRLLALLGEDELTVAEMVNVLGVAQSRVSTHLGRLREAGLIRDRTLGVHRYYRAAGDDMPPVARAAWESLREALAGDPSLRADRRKRELLEARRGRAWVDRVAGSLERHYSPGRTWEALARGLVLVTDLGRVVDLGAGDGAIAELIAPQARRIACVDSSERMVEAGRHRMARAGLRHVWFCRAQMEALPLADACEDLALMQQSLQYARDPALAIREAGRVLRPGGRLLVVTLAAHRHAEVRQDYGQLHLGFRGGEIRRMTARAGLEVDRIVSAGREKRPPNFEALAVVAHKPAARGRSSHGGSSHG